MNAEKLRLLLNGIACISDAANCHFSDVITALEESGILTDKQADAAREA